MVASYESLGYGSEREMNADRFYDEHDEPAQDPKCSDCPEWTRCNVNGHESVGWCSKWGEFFEEGDEQCT